MRTTSSGGALYNFTGLSVPWSRELIALQGPLRGEQAHLFQRLADGRDAGGGYGCGQDVIESHHGTVVRDFQTGIGQSAHNSKSGEIVECKHRGERASRCKYLLRKTQPSFKSRSGTHQIGQLKHRACDRSGFRLRPRRAALLPSAVPYRRVPQDRGRWRCVR